MKVKEYYSDFVLDQKWALQVHVYFIDENDPLVNPIFKYSCFFEYSVPVVQRCKYWENQVNFIKCVGDTITLDVNEYVIKKGVSFDD